MLAQLNNHQQVLVFAVRCEKWDNWEEGVIPSLPRNCKR